jgi:type IV secretory pathway VirB10-like protein
MFSNRLAFAALALACIAAAAGGGFLASRQNTVPAPAMAQSPTSATPATGAAPTTAPTSLATAERPVQETEAVVGDTKPQAPSAKSSGAKRAEKPREAAKSARATSSQPPPLTSTWPSSAGSQAPAPQPPLAPPAPAPVEAASTPRSEEHVVQPPAPEPPPKTLEELIVSRDSVIGVQMENRISSDTARVEDRVEARVTRDVKVGDRVAIPAGSHAVGSVTLVERGGKFKERARLGIRFHTLVLADGTRLPINTETIFREGEAPGNGSAAKIGGGAVGGAILGAILGGAKGAAIGATTGAGAGTAAVMAGDRSAAVLQPGTPLTARLNQPVTVTTEK